MSRLIPQNDCDNCKVARYCSDKDHVINCFIKSELEIMAEQIRADAIEEFRNKLFGKLVRLTLSMWHFKLFDDALQETYSELKEQEKK